MIPCNGKHYLYRHIRLDTNEVFYVGIGTQNKNTKLFHRAHSNSRRNNFWKNIVNKTEYEVEILLESDDYYFIQQKEVEFIALYGRRDLENGTLVNLTDGGEGVINCQYNKEETYLKISKALKGRKKSRDIVDKMCNTNNKKLREYYNNHVGKVYITNEGYKVEIVKCTGLENVTVKFDDGTLLKNKALREIKKGKISNPNHLSVFGIGYLGNVRYKKDISYAKWRSLLKNHMNNVCEEWRNYENFKEWFIINYPSEQSEDYKMCVSMFNESENIVNENTVYFLPKDLCMLFKEEKGFFIRKCGRITSLFRGKHLGFFKTVEEAINKYKEVKKQHILSQVEKYENVFSKVLYDKIINYEIQIKK